MAPNSPACSFIHASMVGSRSTAPLNRSNSVLIVAPHQDRRPQTRGAPTGLSSGSEPIFACTGLHSLKSSFTSALLPRAAEIEPEGRFAGTLELEGVFSHGILRATRWFQGATLSSYSMGSP